jgi:hypothetical protein
LDIPHTEPMSPPTKPRKEPAPAPAPRKAPQPKPQRELDPFNPDWPKTRPTPVPKARVGQ